MMTSTMLENKNTSEEPVKIHIKLLEENHEAHDFRESSFLKRASTINTLSTTCFSEMENSVRFASSGRSYIDVSPTKEAITSANDSGLSYMKEDDPCSTITTRHPFHQALASVVGKQVQHWRKHQKDRKRQEEGCTEQACHRMVQEAQSPEGRVQQKQRLQALGPIGVALFSPMDAAFVVTESRDDEDVTTRMMVPSEETDSGAVHEGLLNGKDVLSARIEYSTPAHVESVDDDDVYLHVIPDDESVPRLLSESVMRELLVQAMPYTLHGRLWKRLYSITRDGDSFETFLSNVKGYDHTIIVVQTSRGEVIGGFADEAWDRGSRTKDVEGRFFGMGTSFLFSLASSCSEPMHIFKWTGANMYNQLCRTRNGGCIGMGGGGGSFGLILQQDFTKGSSGPCDTYGNTQPLTSESCFDILNLEVYGFERYW